jgi:zinc protease
MDGTALPDVEAAATAALEQVMQEGVTEQEVKKAQNQLRARLVFENDSVTNLGHQLGFFETIAAVDLYQHAPRAIAAVTKDEVDRVARKYLRSDQRTVGWFKPRNGGLVSSKPNGEGVAS